VRARNQEPHRDAKRRRMARSRIASETLIDGTKAEGAEDGPMRHSVQRDWR